MDRINKQKKLRHNVEVSTKRWIDSEYKRLKREPTESEKSKMRKTFEESANRIDKTKLHEVWN